MKQEINILAAILSTIPIIISLPQFIANPPDKPKGPVLKKQHITSDIQLRYARTRVESVFENTGEEDDECVFTMTLPDPAVISNFSMVLNEEEFVAKVEEKETASDIYKKEVDEGREAGLVSKTNDRGENVFVVRTNLPAGKEILFKLTYEELLERYDGAYEHIIDVNPGQVVEDLKITVNINETLPVKNLKVPKLLQSNEIDFDIDETENEEAIITENVDGDNRKVKIVFQPDKAYQEEAGFQGVRGKFQMSYDVDRSGQDSEVQVIDGYFVHYFVPENLETLPKHAIFILDISGSMAGERLSQLKDAMFVVLNEMSVEDRFNIITFSDSVSQWKEGQVLEATEENKREAIKYVLGLSAGGGTDINQAILDGLQLSKSTLRSEELPKDMASMVVFLTDGEATAGVTESAKIKSNIKDTNDDLETAIFCIGFGTGADFNLLKDISKESDSFAKQVYEGSNAALELEGFYIQISSPLITNLKFTYLGGSNNSDQEAINSVQLETNQSKLELSDTGLKTLFNGGQFVVSGKLDEEPNNQVVRVDVTGNIKGGLYEKHFDICPWSINYDKAVAIPSIDCVHPKPSSTSPRSKDQEFIQNLHAFLNIKQLISKDDEESRNEALTLALDNNFVTSLTSLVVVKPDRKSYIVEDEPELIPIPQNAIASLSGSPGYSYGAFNYASSGPKSAAFNPISTRASSKNRIRNRMTTTTRPFRSTTTTTSYVLKSSLDASYDYPSNFQVASFNPSPVYDLSYDYFEEQVEQNDNNSTKILTQEIPTNCSGNLTLYSSTYLRGDSLLVTDDEMLSLPNFEDKTVSLEVEGDCCWRLYGGRNFTGESKLVSSSEEYKGVLSLAPIVLDLSSVRKDYCY